VGNITEQGLRMNVDVGIQYLEAWLAGNGCVPIYNLMEDAATAEISRSQVWQWVRHGVKMNDGRTVTMEVVKEAIADELARKPGLPTKRLASKLFEDMMTRQDFQEFLTTAAYEYID
jgi:malate synthase